MSTRGPAPTDHYSYSASRNANAGPDGGNWDPSGQPRGFPSGGLRASDAERDAALAELSQHFQAGRLTADELDDRTSQILAARTGDELELQLRDLPNLAAPPAAQPEYGPPANRRSQLPAIVVTRIVVGVVVLAVIATVLSLGAGHHGVHPWSAIGPVVIVLLVLRRCGRRR